MDVEKRMEFILDTLAEVGVKQARTERRMYELQALAKIGLRHMTALGAFHKVVAALRRVLAASGKLSEKSMREMAASQKAQQSALATGRT